MEKNDKRLIILVFAILIAIFLFNFNKISGRVTSQTGVSIDLNSNEVVLREDDNSKVITLIVDTGLIGLEKEYILRDAENGERKATDNLCSDSVCEGKISNNFRIDRNIKPGKYYFEFTRKCAAGFLGTYCDNPDEDLKFKSPIFEVKYVV